MRRLLSAAITDGLELAGRTTGIEGDSESVAKECAARIVSDMILAGRGEEVLKLGAVLAPKGGDDDGKRGKSPVLDALSRMPGMLPGREPSQVAERVPNTAEESDTCATRTTDGRSGARAEQADQVAPRPFFAPQLPLLPAELSGSRGPAGAGAAAAGAGTPHPPARGATPPTYPGSAPLEKSENDEAAA